MLLSRNAASVRCGVEVGTQCPSMAVAWCSSRGQRPSALREPMLGTQEATDLLLCDILLVRYDNGGCEDVKWSKSGERCHGICSCSAINSNQVCLYGCFGLALGWRWCRRKCSA
ncbi:hypothetical protein E2562_002396 [Oryza meyeriana var. granulata]|uniref:Uncharacterized protein n=1 Tax=Oryza meyeriana var. granulata TaxID=110450 RepID=A0A6G1BIP0_9ORYZ|nr:hypothetical protein E2562_002396 [Oryza meyeriana var. granulata]